MLYKMPPILNYRHLGESLREDCQSQCFAPRTAGKRTRMSGWIRFTGWSTNSYERIRPPDRYLPLFPFAPISPHVEKKGVFWEAVFALPQPMFREGDGPLQLSA